MNVSKRAGSGQISVDVCSPDDPALIGAWAELAARLDANVFMHPAALSAAEETGRARIHVLLAWDDTDTPRRPVGFWALRERRDLSLTPAFLETLPYDYAFTSNAVIDGAHVDDIVAAFFDAIRRDPGLPKVVSLKSFEADPVVYPAMLRRLAETGCHRELLRVERPFADRSCGLSESRRKKQRRLWNQLSEAGAEIVDGRSPAEAEAAFETFLALEAAGWKGEQSTALLCDEGDARFVRRLFRDLARQGLASVVLLRLDGEAIAALVVLYSGSMIHTWKIAFNAHYAGLSPGKFLMCKITEMLLGSGPISAIDSCSASGQGWVADLWSGRRTMVDALIDVGPRTALGFALEAACHRSHVKLGHMRDRMRLAARRKAR